MMICLFILADDLNNDTSQKSINYNISDYFVLVEGGTFQMGAINGEPNERPVHIVTVSSFYIGKYEVTQKEWKVLMEDNPSNFKGDDRPVESITWYQAVEFCNKLSQKEGLTPVYTICDKEVSCNWDADGYRLPTEAEWEFAARGGNQSKHFQFSGSNDKDEVAWYHENSNDRTHPVGSKLPNELGIYDMSGNIVEWCWDWYGSYSSTVQINPRGATSGSRRVDRGSSWYYYGIFCRVAFRHSRNPDNDFDDYGFRLVRAHK